MLAPTLATRLLLRRGLWWMSVTLAATALLMVLVDWVEHGSRVSSAAGSGPAVMESLRLALLLLPSHLSLGLPIVAALGASLAVVGLRRSGEWQALGAAGLGPTRLLAPFALLGGLAGLLTVGLDAWVTPVTSHAHATSMAAHQGSPLRQDDAAWFAQDGLIFRLEGDPASGLLGTAAVLMLPRGDGSPLQSWQSAQIRWAEPHWVSSDPGGDRSLPADAPSVGSAPWERLPAPAALSQLIGSQPASSHSWSTLLADPRPSSLAERHSRGSRPLVAPLAALVAAALTALLAPSSVAVLLAAAPVLAWELAATLAQTQVALGHLPPACIPGVRLGLALALALVLVRRLGRP